MSSWLQIPTELSYDLIQQDSYIQIHYSADEAADKAKRLEDTVQQIDPYNGQRSNPTKLHYYTRPLQACDMQKDGIQKHTTGGIPRWSPTLVLVARFSAYVWQSGRDAQFSLTYGRMYYEQAFRIICNIIIDVCAV